MARDPDKLRDAPWRDRAEVMRGDLGDVHSLTEAFDGVDVVYYLVHSMGTSSDFVSEEARSAHNVVAAAKQAGVRRIVYLSGLHPDGELSPHLRSRTAVGDILMDSGVETLVLQCGQARARHRCGHPTAARGPDRLPRCGHAGPTA